MKSMLKIFAPVTICLLIFTACGQNPAESAEHKALMAEHEIMEEEHEKLERKHAELEEQHNKMVAEHDEISDPATDSLHTVIETEHA